MSKIYYESEGYLSVVVERKKKPMRISEIFCVESDGRKLIFHTSQEQVICYAKMGDVEPYLKENGFVRVHQSFLVREDGITDVTKNSVETKWGMIPVSRRYYQTIKDNI